MNVQDYIAAGYPLSNLIAQAVITRAEKDVTAAYLVPLLGHVPTAGELATGAVKNALMGLSALLVQQRSISATRAGAKSKMTDQSNTPAYADVLRQGARTCVQWLNAIEADGKPEDVCSDICGIFFRTNYFYNH